MDFVTSFASSISWDSLGGIVLGLASASAIVLWRKVLNVKTWAHRQSDAKLVQSRADLKQSKADLRQSRAELFHTEETFRVMVESVRDYAIFMLDANGFVTTWNTGAERITGYTADDIIGKHFSTFYTQEARDRRHPDYELEVAKREGRYEEEGVRVRKDGRLIYSNVLITALYDAQGNLSGFSKVTRDITERRQAQEALQRAYAELETRVEERTKELAKAKEMAESANLAKGEFLANMSHEIRTPLNAILGYSDLLRDPDTEDEDRSTYLDTIERNGRVLAQLIDDILDLSKVEAGALHFEKERLSVGRLIGDLRSTLNVVAESKGIKLTFDYPASVPPMIFTDPIRLRQILLNIVGNAIKFTDEGAVTLAVAFSQETAEKQSQITFTVTDTGCGLSEEAQRRLFRPFAQGDSSTTRRYGGTGLGLLLSRRLAQALSGDVILVRSAVGQGSVFQAFVDAGTLSQRETPTATRIGFTTAAPSSMAEAKLDGMKILVAEDSPDNQALIRRILTRAGAEVEVVPDGRVCVDRALTDTFDMVLMDVQMPNLDGYGATSELRRRGYEKPIIALTAHAMQEERERSERAGCNDHLAKPINLKRLLEKIKQYAGQSGHVSLH